MHRDDALDADDARARVDRHLRDLAAERVDAEALGVRAARAGAVDRRVAELPRHLDDVDVERAVARADPPAGELRSSAAISKHVGGEAQELSSRTFPAALRTAGITAGVVIEPPETGL